MRSTPMLAALLVLGSFSRHAPAQQLVILGADGSDGDLVVSGNVTLDLGAAAAGEWTAIGAGNGIYDAEKFSVVFKYASVDVRPGAVLSFANHPSRAPVVWLVAGDVTIDGEVNLDGAASAVGTEGSQPGPGGFRGGYGDAGDGSSYSGGFGPGGAARGSQSGAAHEAASNGSGVVYGTARIMPLLGGSGGSGNPSEGGSGRGGAGGGALLIAAAGTVSISGLISADGGVRARGAGNNWSGDGSGGAVRIVADRFVASDGATVITARGPNQASAGWIRVEANAFEGAPLFDPAVADRFVPDDPVLIWPPDDIAPTVEILSIGGVDLTGVVEPRGSLEFAQEDAEIPFLDTPLIRLRTTNLEPAALVRVRIVPRQSDPLLLTATHESGGLNESFWRIENESIPTGGFVMQAIAEKP